MSHLLQLVLLLALVLLGSKLAGALSLRLGQPAVFGKILFGLLLGPTFLNLLHWHLGALWLFSDPPAMVFEAAHAGGVENTLHDLAEIGVLLLMFMAGLETEIRQVLKVGRAALLAALGGVALPMLSAFGACALFSALGLHFSIFESLFIGCVLSATSVSISAQTLMELGRLRSREGSAILGAAVIDDVAGILILSVLIALRPAGSGAGQPEKLLDWIMLGLGTGLSPGASGAVRIMLLLLLMAAFFGLALAAERFFLRPLIRRFERLPVSESLLAAVLIAGLLYAWAAEWIGGVAAITGTYFCGVLLARSELKDEIEAKLHTITYALFVPVFFVSIGLTADARPIFAPLASPSDATAQQWLLLTLTVVLIALAIGGKVLGCMWGARLGGFSRTESLRVGIGMISRGEVGIIVALVGLNAGIIDEGIFSIMVLMVLVTTLVTPIWLKASFREKREATPPTENALEA